MSQPALTTSIRTLEKDLGFELFDRERGFELTGLGRELLPRADELLARAADLERELTQARLAQLGELRVACGPAVADGLLGVALGRLLKRAEGAKIEVVVVRVQEFLPLLERREVDLVVGEPSPFEGRQDVEQRALEAQPIVFFCRAGHPLAGEESVGFERFFAYPQVATELPPWIAAWLDANRPAAAKSQALALTCSHYELLQRVVERTDAISGAPRPVVERRLREGRLAEVRLAVPPMHNRMAVVHLKARRLTPLGEQLSDELARAAAGATGAAGRELERADAAAEGSAE